MLGIGDEVVVREILQHNKVKTYEAKVEGIYEYFINVRHKNGYIISISKIDIGRRILIQVRREEKVEEKLTKEILTEEMKTMTWEEIAEKHGFKRPGLIKGLAVKWGLIEGTGVYAERKSKNKEEERKMNNLKPIAFEGKSGFGYKIEGDTIVIFDAIDTADITRHITVVAKKFGLFADEINELKQYINSEE